MRYGLERHKTTRAILLRATRPLEASLSAPGPNSFCPCAPQAATPRKPPGACESFANPAAFAKRVRTAADAQDEAMRRPKSNTDPGFDLAFDLDLALVLPWVLTLILTWLGWRPAQRALGGSKIRRDVRRAICARRPSRRILARQDAPPRLPKKTWPEADSQPQGL